MRSRLTEQAVGKHLRENIRAAQGLLERISGRADFQQHRPRREMLVIARGAQQQIAHEARRALLAQGLQVGGAQVSEKHAGFIINRGGATASDVAELMRQVQKTVQEREGVLLEPEIRLLGSFEEGM